MSASYDANPGELGPADQAAMVRALQAGLDDGEIQRIETHISEVLVGRTLAYKFKKVLANDFLDFRTLARRHQACVEELRLNRRLAPDLYLAVVPVTGSIAAPVLNGSGPVLDWAVAMRAFDRQGQWDRLAERGALRAGHIDALVPRLDAFYRGAARADPAGRLGDPVQVRAAMRACLADVRRHLPPAGATEAQADRLAAWEAEAFRRWAPALAERLRDGHVRECHGDLHLGNIAQWQGEPMAFDGIEFNDEFRWIDVASDLAFLSMDLRAHGLAGLAHRLLNGWLERSGDYGAARVLRYHEVYRALVRARVATLRLAQARQAADATLAHRYLDLAEQLSRPRTPVVLITHGFSGSGKTTLTEGLMEAGGVVRIRSDVERKRLAGVAPLDRPTAADLARRYGAQARQATYARLREAADAVLDGGHSVVLDATFLARAERDAVRQWVDRRGLRWRILDFQVDADVLRQRVERRARRGDDASDADLPVLEAQLRHAEALGPDELPQVVACHAARDADGGWVLAEQAALLAWLDPGA